MIKLQINNQHIEAEEGSTILEIARLHNIYIPTLCYSKNNLGHCRLCVVEVDGILTQACSTIVKENMIIITNTPKIEKIRITILELIFKNHNTKCYECPKIYSCKLQEISTEFNLNLNEKYHLFNNYPPPQILENFLPNINYDESKCIFCKRCMKLFNKQNEFAKIRFITENGKSSLKTDIIYKEKIDSKGLIEECPTGALFLYKIK